MARHRNAAKPFYNWESVGDQDECTRKLCYLGPYLLEHVEDYWEDDKMMMLSIVWLWDDKERTPVIYKELPVIEYKKGVSTKPLEDWYAMNVLFEEILLGKGKNEK